MNHPATASITSSREWAGLSDVHCHILPGVDDGAQTLEESWALARALVADGVSSVIATPHQMGRYAGKNGPAEIREKAMVLQRSLDEAGIALKVLPGGDVRIEEDLGKRIQADGVLTLGDLKKHILLELPHEAYFEPWGLLAELQAMGIQSILSHPERHHHVQQQPALAGAWLKHGVLLQVTSGSLTGDFGEAAQKCAWQLMTYGAISILASDAHDCDRRPPRMKTALKMISDKLAGPIARRLVDNAQRVVDGQAIAVPFVPMLAARRR